MEMIQSLPELKVGEVVRDQLVAQVGSELFVLFEEGVLEIGTEDMVAVLDAVDDGGEFATHPAVHPCAEDCRDLVAGEPPQTELAAAFEQFVDGKVSLEDEVAAVFDLGDRVEARQAESGALLGGELRTQDQRPVVEAFADDLRAQPIGGGLQRGNVIDREKGVVDLAEADLGSVQLLLDEAVAIEVIRGLERQERGDPHDHRAEGFVADVEVVVGEATALTRQDAIIGVLGGVFWYGDAKGRPLLHALEDVIDTVVLRPRHAALPRLDMVFLAHALFGPFDRDAMIACEGFHPVLVVSSALAQDLLADHGNANDLMEEVHHPLGARQSAEVAVYDDAVEAVVNKGKQVAE